ncbi:sensor histidine kinase [Rhizobium rhizoryzae]|uniref:sensor histidine kinase n=1 Tax=Rhizobium rhizoryzae TaxID=451876 RepID=UPI00289D5C8B|nr:HWE histidine kinase domain-containing protein [Rhizobium rhizoryzae]
MPPPSYTTDATRLAGLASYDILDTPAEQGFDDIVSLACLLCETPVALVSLVAGDRQWFKARIGFEPCETDLDSSVCAHALIEDDLLVIADLSKDERTHQSPLVTGEPHIRFYAGAPLRDDDGHVLGSLCVIDGTPRPEGLTASQAEGLRGLARQVMTQLHLRRTILERDAAMSRQKEIERKRHESEEQYQRLFEAIEDGFCIVEMKFDGDVAVDYRFIEINPAFAAQTGLVDAHGKWMRDLAPDHEQHWFDIYGGVALNGQPVRFEHFAKELDERWFDVHAFRVGDPSRRRVGILFTDKSERKEADNLKRLAEDAQKVLNEELSHRMKNTFAMVQAIATQTLRGVTERDAVEAFTQRLHALSTAHDVLLKQSWSNAKLGDVVSAVLSTFIGSKNLEVSGPLVNLGPRATLSVSLLLHELATNAMKYGSLLHPDGLVAITWRIRQVDGEDDLVLDWKETGGPPAVDPERKGFGSKLIRMGLVGTGGVDVSYLQSGFEAEFHAPLAQVQFS